VIFGFGVRLTIVSTCNYLFGNSLFAFLWVALENHLKYWEIAVLSTCVASIFSYQTQSRFLLKQEAGAIINARFILFQLFGLFMAVLLVPSLTTALGTNLIVMQFAWSAFFSSITLVLLRKRKFNAPEGR